MDWSGFFTSNYYFKGLIRKSSKIFYDIENYFSIHRLLNYIDENNASKINYTEIINNLEDVLVLVYFRIIN